MIMKNLYKLLFCLLFLTCSSGDENDSNEIIDLTVSISANLSSLTFENTMVSQTSIPKVIIINTENATSEITVNAPDGYEVSVNNTFSSSISFQPEISNEVYIRFSPVELVNYNSTLQISSDELNNIQKTNLKNLRKSILCERNPPLEPIFGDKTCD